ncbi:hypothetical protein THIOM_001393 [Candidatus Thiomargarita nelsonii]|uniref:Putative DNA-binding domain-containing protein n=1 Tax=Candidatus Thiomargarita nelsonii TaxID=1003181 RepID=A0A0A6P0N5_9GAMM|nr:hypothetical protein THIOM_001393 [Candidatus Thiomargarita nelsonii]
MELAALQQLFYEAIFDKSSTSSEALCQQITTAPNLTVADGIAIYRDSIVGKLSNTLQAIYPVCYRLVGEAFFEMIASTYLHRSPSTSPDLGDYGEDFPEFLAHFESAASLPYLPDIARLEWHWHRIFNGEETSVLDFQALANIPQEKWGELIFHLPKASVLLESVYPIHRIWQVNQPDYEGDESVNLNEGGIKILLWRQNDEMRIDLPTPSEWQLLKAFQSEHPFALICEELAQNEASVDVSALLTQFVQRGWIADFSFYS